MKKTKIAIPKSGRLHNETLKCFSEAGFEFEKDNTGFQLKCTNGDFDLVLMREKDIPMLVRKKTVDNGICGENSFFEFDWLNVANTQILYKFSFGKCRLSIAGKTFLKSKQLGTLDIATSYVEISENLGVNGNLIHLHGSVEHAIELGLADVIIDIVSTGETLKKSGLIEGEVLMQIQPILIGESNDVIQDVLFKIKANEEAKNKKYVMLNCKEEDIDKICNILPSAKSPTIIPLAREDMFAIHTLCDEKALFLVYSQLAKAGASDVVISKPSKIF